ncbi:MAG: PG0541 family transporter-associated protein [Fusobacteriaceae bacterium]
MEWLKVKNADDNSIYKQVTIYLNETQKNSLVKFLEDINFYGYAVVTDVESNWSKSIRHRNNHTWPGADCIFYMTVEETQVNTMINELKKYRMNYPENVVFALGILPIEKIIPNLYTY